MKRIASLVAVAGGMFSWSVALAQGGPNDRALAEALFQDARQLVASEQWTPACAKFAESQRLDPKLGTLLYLATCHEREGKLASAWAEFTEARALASRANQADRERIAKERVNALEPRLSRIVVEAEEPAPKITFELDGKSLSTAVLGSSMPIDPGEHVVQATAPEREPATVKVLVAGEGQTFRVKVPKLRAPTPVAPPPAPPAPPPPEPSNPSQRTVGTVIVGLGAASLAVGGVLGVVALTKDSNANALCNGKICTQEGLDLHDSAHTLAHFSTAGLALGIVGIGVGGYLLLSAPTATPTAAVIVPIAGPGVVGASASARF